jgi:hypothetical protein
MSPSLLEPPLLSRLRAHDRILIAGAGGGFDIYAGLPLFLALRAAGKQVSLANLTFTNLGETNAIYLASHVAVVTPATAGADRYFPERRLAEWLADEGHPDTVFAFEKVGVRPLRAAYARLLREVGATAVVLVDGGTDILMRGDESGLGTPEEDMTSLAAVSGLSDIESFVASIGFGIDAFHDVCHVHVLENIAAIDFLLVGERRFQEAQNATTVRFHVPGRELLLRAIPCIRSRLASGETDATTPGILEKAVPPVTLLPEGHDASVILGLVESEADWTLTICRSNRLLGVTQTANAVTLHVPLNPSRSSVPPAVVRSDQSPPWAIVLRSTWPSPSLIRPPAPMANLPGGQLAVTAWKASDPAVPVALTICRPGGGSAQIAYAWSAHVPAKPVWSSDAATT